MRSKLRIAVLVLLPLILAVPAIAQFAQRGNLEGFVFDSSGAIVPGANVTLVDVAENTSRKAVTDKTGHFSFADVTAGQYQVIATANGFETEKSEPIAVDIGSTRRYDFKLAVGSVSQSVTVSADAAPLETGQANIDTNVSEQQMQSLPLNGRNFTEVAALAPGVATLPQLNINPGGTFSVGSQFASGGTIFTSGGLIEGSRDNGFYINGVNINDNYESSVSYAPSVEAISSATLSVADLGAANGRDISTLNVQTKGGGSRFHGEIYDFVENTIFNAANPFDKAETQLVFGDQFVKPTLVRNQFGGGAGGPIYVPKVAPWLRDKAFFFANYEKFTESDGSEPVFTSVPSGPERTGDFSELLGGPSPLQLYNPFYTTYNSQGYSSRPIVPGNRLDLASKPDGTSLVDPASAALLALYPLPTNPNTPSYLPNYQTTQNLGFTNYHFDSRFDVHLTENDLIFVTWSRQHGTNDNSGNVTPSYLYLSDIDDKSNLITVNYAHVFTSNLTNEAIFGTGYGALVTQSPGELSFLNSDGNPFNGLFQNTGQGITRGVLAMDVYNYASPGFNEVFRAENDTFQISDNISWIHGRHSVSAGLNYFRKREYDWDFVRFVTFGEGSYENGFPRQQFSSGGYLQNYAGGDGAADLVMGIPQVIHQRYNFVGGDPTAPEVDVQFPYWGFYVNDKFQISPKITLSAGLRYDLDIPGYSPNHVCCAVYQPTVDGGIVKIPGIATGLPTHYLSAPKLDFAPRISLAYSPQNSIVLRAGYGIFYDAGATQIANFLDDATGAIPGLFIGDELSNQSLGIPSDTPALKISQIFQPQPNLTGGEYPVSTGPGQGYFGSGAEQAIYYSDQKSVPLPYYQRYIAEAQKQVTPHDVITISYIGAQGRKGSNYINTNLPPYQTGWPDLTTFNAARPNNLGRFSDIYVNRPTLNSHYNAAIVRYQHVFRNGIQFLSNYTWGKTVSDYPYQNALALNSYGGASGFQYPNIRNRGEATFSHRQRFVFSGIWQPIYGATWSQWAKVPLTGWRLAGIATLESGDTATIQNVLTSANDFAGLDELNVIANEDPNLDHGEKTFSKGFNTGAFTVPPNGVRGNSGLGTIRAPGQNNVDLSLAKVFEIYRTLHFEFRADAFNAFNHTQWNGVQTTYPYASVGNYGNIPFGQVTGAREARIGQLALKLAF